MDVLKTQFQQVDTNAFLWVQRRFCQKTHMPIVRFISSTGDGWLYLMIAIAVYLLGVEQAIPFIVTSLVAYFLQVPLYMLLKKKFKRNRPEDFITSFKARIEPSDQFSFPSGHTAAAFVMATQILIYFPFLSIVGFIWAISIGISRVLLGVHFPGDILAGIALGILCALTVNELFSMFSFL